MDKELQQAINDAIEVAKLAQPKKSKILSLGHAQRLTITLLNLMRKVSKRCKT
jgi:hypothetical protein